MNEVMISIGDVSKRSGMAASAIRFYEEQGLIKGTRSASGRRQYPRDVLRRIAFIRAAQNIGLSLVEVRTSLATLPEHRTPTKQDWARLSRNWQPLLQQRIDSLLALRDKLTSCIGCGCLSLKSCGLSNPGDIAQTFGSGARYLTMTKQPDVPREK